MNTQSNTANEKKLVGIFKQFVEKAIVPVIKGNDSAVSEWQYFSSLLGQDTLDYSKLQIYVDVLSNSKSYNEDVAKKEEDRSKYTNFFKRREETAETENTYTFQPSKTFGPSSKPALFPLKGQDFLTPSIDKEIFAKKEEKKANVQKLLSNMEQLHKNFNDNHTKLEQSSSLGGYGTYKYEDRKYL